MNITPIHTDVIEYKKYTIESFLDQYVTALNEESIIAITSKVISVIEGNLVDKNIISKIDLIKQEADHVLNNCDSKHNFYLTIKNGLMIASAGIDESNVDNCYVLYPKDVFESSKKIWNYLREKFNLDKLGVIITDSKTSIMRRGVSGIAIGWCGFKPLKSYVGNQDIYGRIFKVSQINILDSLASAAVFVMGEGAERNPIAIISNAPHMSYLNREPSTKEREEITIALEEDLYYPLLKNSSLK